MVDVPAGARSTDPRDRRTGRRRDGVAVVPPPGRARRRRTAEVTVVERFGSDDVDAAACVPSSSCVGRRAPASRYLTVQDLGPQAGRSPSRWLAVGRRPRSPSPRRRLGGDYARLRTDCRLDGRGATGNLLAVYFGEGDQMLDFRTFQDHRAPDTTSQPAVQGRRRRPSPLGLHRPHPGPEGRPGHQRLPDQPQHQAVRPRLGRVGAQPRDREQRRALQPRLDGRARSTTTSASTSRAAACRPRSPSGSSWPASSTRCSSAPACAAARGDDAAAPHRRRSSTRDGRRDDATGGVVCTRRPSDLARRAPPRSRSTG